MDGIDVAPPPILDLGDVHLLEQDDAATGEDGETIRCGSSFDSSNSSGNIGWCWSLKLDVVP